MKEENIDIRMLDRRHFREFAPVKYENFWYSEDGRKTAILEDSVLRTGQDRIG